METDKDKERSSESSQYKVTSFTTSFLSLSLKDWQGFRYSIVVKQIWKSHHLFLWEVDNLIDKTQCWNAMNSAVHVLYYWLFREYIFWKYAFDSTHFLPIPISYTGQKHILVFA